MLMLRAAANGERASRVTKTLPAHLEDGRGPAVVHVRVNVARRHFTGALVQPNGGDGVMRHEKAPAVARRTPCNVIGRRF